MGAAPANTDTDVVTPNPRDRALVASGNHFEMGFAQGEALKHEIVSAIEACAQQEAFQQEKPRWMPNAVFLWLVKQQATRLLSEALARDFFEIHQRLKGLAAGTGLDMRTVYLANAVESLMSFVNHRSVVPSMAACSAVAVRGGRSANGEPFIARNFDYVPFIQPYFLVRESRPVSGYRSLDFTIATMCGTVDGVNERGLCITYNYAYTADEGAPAATVSMLITEVLERCCTVAEAAEWIASRPRWGGAILMLADADGDIASLELSSTRSRLRRPREGEDLLFHTNQFQSPGMRQVEVSQHAVFNTRAHSALHGRRVLESAELRLDRLAELLESTAQFQPNDLANVLADHGPSDEPSENSLCSHGPYQCTTACLQLFPRARKLRISYSAACEAAFEELQI